MTGWNIRNFQTIGEPMTHYPITGRPALAGDHLLPNVWRPAEPHRERPQPVVSLGACYLIAGIAFSAGWWAAIWMGAGQ